MENKKNDILLALEHLAEMYKLSQEEVDQLFEDAFEKIFQAEYDPDAKLSFDNSGEKLVIKTEKMVVEDNEFDKASSAIEIKLSDALKIDKSVKVDDLIMVEVDLDLFEPRVRAKIKGVLTQKIKELRKHKIFSMFKEKVGEMVEGTVTTNNDKFALLQIKSEIGDIAAYMPEKYKNSKIKYFKPRNYW